jgi:hypothetical protein
MEGWEEDIIQHLQKIEENGTNLMIQQLEK